jgi:hypothetical protein
MPNGKAQISKEVQMAESNNHSCGSRDFMGIIYFTLW